MAAQITGYSVDGVMYYIISSKVEGRQSHYPINMPIADRKLTNEEMQVIAKSLVGRSYTVNTDELPSIVGSFVPAGKKAVLITDSRLLEQRLGLVA